MIIPFSPALLILWAPGGMRFTCYYYRGAYYKSFWADPPACAVSEPRKTYWGENSFPLIMQNIHRYFLYLAILFVIVLTYDAFKARWFIDPTTGEKAFCLCHRLRQPRVLPTDDRLSLRRADLTRAVRRFG